VLELTDLELEYLSQQDLSTIIKIFDTLSYKQANRFIHLSSLPQHIRIHLMNLPQKPPSIVRESLAHIPDKTKHCLAHSRYTAPQDLSILSEDPSPGIRSAVAKNPNTPREIKVKLTYDDDPYVCFDATQEIENDILRKKIHAPTPDPTALEALPYIFSIQHA
jgi:hypothetical protein